MEECRLERADGNFVVVFTLLFPSSPSSCPSSCFDAVFQLAFSRRSQLHVDLVGRTLYDCKTRWRDADSTLRTEQEGGRS